MTGLRPVDTFNNSTHTTSAPKPRNLWTNLQWKIEAVIRIIFNILSKLYYQVSDSPWNSSRSRIETAYRVYELQKSNVIPVQTAPAQNISSSSSSRDEDKIFIKNLAEIKQQNGESAYQFAKQVVLLGNKFKGKVPNIPECEFLLPAVLSAAMKRFFFKLTQKNSGYTLFFDQITEIFKNHVDCFSKSQKACAKKKPAVGSTNEMLFKDQFFNSSEQGCVYKKLKGKKHKDHFADHQSRKIFFNTEAADLIDYLYRSLGLDISFRRFWDKELFFEEDPKKNDQSKAAIEQFLCESSCDMTFLKEIRDTYLKPMLSNFLGSLLANFIKTENLSTLLTVLLSQTKDTILYHLAATELHTHPEKYAKSFANALFNQPLEDKYKGSIAKQLWRNLKIQLVSFSPYMTQQGAFNYIFFKKLIMPEIEMHLKEIRVLHSHDFTTIRRLACDYLVNYHQNQLSKKSSYTKKDFNSNWGSLLTSLLGGLGRINTLECYIFRSLTQRISSEQISDLTHEYRRSAIPLLDLFTDFTKNNIDQFFKKFSGTSRSYKEIQDELSSQTSQFSAILYDSVSNSCNQSIRPWGWAKKRAIKAVAGDSQNFTQAVDRAFKMLLHHDACNASLFLQGINVLKKYLPL